MKLSIWGLLNFLLCDLALATQKLSRGHVVEYVAAATDGQGRLYAKQSCAQYLPKPVRAFIYAQAHQEVDMAGAHYELIRRYVNSSSLRWVVFPYTHGFLYIPCSSCSLTAENISKETSSRLSWPPPPWGTWWNLSRTNEKANPPVLGSRALGQVKLVTATISPTGSNRTYFCVPAMETASKKHDKDSRGHDAFPSGALAEPVVRKSVERVHPPGMGFETKGVPSVTQCNLYDHLERGTHTRSCWQMFDTRSSYGSRFSR